MRKRKCIRSKGKRKEAISCRDSRRICLKEEGTKEGERKSQNERERLKTEHKRRKGETRKRQNRKEKGNYNQEKRKKKRTN